MNGSGRRSRRGRVPGPMVALSALGVLLAGCGSGSSPVNAHDRFNVQVDKVCARAVAAHARHSFPIADFDPEHPDPAQLPLVGEYFATDGGLPEVDAALRALTPPAEDATAWRAMLDLADQMVTNAQRQITAARARDVRGFVNTLTVTNELATKINSAGARFGFKEETACGVVFG